jgi:hypothetical protein
MAALVKTAKTNKSNYDFFQVSYFVIFYYSDRKYDNAAVIHKMVQKFSEFLRLFAKLPKASINFVMSVCPYETTRFPLDVL